MNRSGDLGKEDFDRVFEACSLDNDDEFPTLHKLNIDAWESLTYGWIIRGMLVTEPNLQYGRAMTLADNLTCRLFKDVKWRYKQKK